MRVHGCWRGTDVCACVSSRTQRAGHGAGKILMPSLKYRIILYVCLWVHRIVYFVLKLQRYVQIVCFQIFLRAEMTYFIYELESQILCPHIPKKSSFNYLHQERKGIYLNEYLLQ